MTNLKLAALFLMSLLVFSCSKDEDDGDNNNNNNTNNNNNNNTNNNNNNNNSAWTTMDDFPGNGRYYATAFTIGDVGYVGLGATTTEEFDDFWKYDPATGNWTQIADFPGGARYGAIAFVLGTNAYVAYGRQDAFTQIYDMWKYDSTTDTWTEMNVPSVGEAFSSTLVINSKAYIIGGSYVAEYNESTDQWTSKSDFPGESRESGVAFTIGNKGYFGTGFDDGDAVPFLNDFWEYDPSTDAWTQLADVPSTSRSSAVGFAIGNFGYVATGNNLSNTFKDLKRYNPATDTWTALDDFPGGNITGAVAFEADGKGYVGTGSYLATYYQKFYELAP